MEISRIDQNVAIQQRETQDIAKKRLQLFNGNAMQSGGFQQDFSALKAGGSTTIDTAVNAIDSQQSIRLNDGSDVNLPALQAEEKAKADRIYSSVSPEAAAQIEAAAKELSEGCYGHAALERAVAKGEPGSIEQLESVSAAVRAAVENTVQSVAFGMLDAKTAAATATAKAMTGSKSGQAYNPPTPTNMNLTPKQLSEGMTDAMTIGMNAVEGNIRELLESFSAKQEMGTEIGTDATELAEMLGDWPEGSQSFTWHEAVTDENGNTVLQEKTDMLTKEEAEALLQELQSTADGLASISSVDGYKLQVAVQDYQQAMTTLSNVMKNYDEDLKSIIGNIRG